MPHAIEGLDTRRIAVVDQEGDVAAPRLCSHARTYSQGQVVDNRQLLIDPFNKATRKELLKLKYVVFHVSEASPLYDVAAVPVLDGELT